MLRAVLTGTGKLRYLFSRWWTRLNGSGQTSLLAKAAVLALAWTAPAQADTIYFSGGGATSLEGQGDFSASLSYTASSSTSATLDISLTNTSPVANGGYIVAFALNNPGGITNVAQGSPFGTNFNLIGAATGETVDASPLGTFDFGASTSSSFAGGGKPSNGIGVGPTEEFVFNLTGTSLDSLTASSFGNALNSDGYYFAVRFAGFNNLTSDKVWAGPYSTSPPPSPSPSPSPSPGPSVPESTTVVLWAGLGLGLAGSRVVRRYLRGHVSTED